MGIWYRAGTVSVTAGSAVVTGVTVAWLSQARAGDSFRGPDGRDYEILKVDSNTQLTLATTYAGTTVSSGAYEIKPYSPLRSAVAALSSQIANFLQTIRGVYGGTDAPSNAVGNDGDYYFRSGSAPRLYTKTSGAWDAGISLVGPQGAIGPGYSTTSTTTQTIGAGVKTFAVAQSGTSYLGSRMRAASTIAPTNAMEGICTAATSTSITLTVDVVAGSGSYADWSLVVAGERGAPGAQGAASTGTSATTNTITTGSKTFTVPAALDLIAGQRVRFASSAAPTTAYIEGIISSYTGASLAVAVDVAVGSGSVSAWTFGPTGERGPKGDTGADSTVAGPPGPSYIATSTTSLSIGTGNKILSVAAGTAYSVGSRVRMASAGSPSTRWMEGECIAYAAGSMTVAVDLAEGSGSYADWSLSIAGEPGKLYVRDGSAALAARGQLGALAVDLDYDDGTAAWVYSDEFPENNAEYTKSGARYSGSWARTGNLPFAANQIVTGATAYGDELQIASVDADFNIASGRTVEGRIISPGHLETAQDATFCEVVAYSNGEIARATRATDGYQLLRGWEQVAGWPVLSHVVVLGQSLSCNAEALPAVTTTETYGALQFERGQNTWYETENAATPTARNAQWFDLVPLSHDWVAAFGVTGEGVSSGISTLKGALAGGGAYVAADMTAHRPYLLFSNPCRGSRYLSEINYENTGSTGHFATFSDDITRAKAQAQARAWSYGVTAFVFMQGENDGGNSQLYPAGPVLGWSALRSGYAAKLIASYAQWDSAARAITGQNRPIPMFIAQMAHSRAIGTAQHDAAVTDPHIYLAGPTYNVPSAINSEYSVAGVPTHGSGVHLSADGARWVGEMIAKAMRRVLIEGKDWKPLYPTSLTRASDTSIVIKFNVPHGPLAWETYHLPDALSKGFAVYLGTPSAPGSQRTITGVAITSADEVTITLSAGTPVTAGASAFVDYAYTSSQGDCGATIATVRTGTAFGNGQASTEVKLNTSVAANVARFLREGAFQIKVYSSGTPTMWVRASYEEGGVTVLKGETREVTGSLVSGASVVEFLRDRPWGNLRDSDPSLSTYTFTDTRYGTRQGTRYPLTNAACSFAEMIAT